MMMSAVVRYLNTSVGQGLTVLHNYMGNLQEKNLWY